MDIIVQNSVFDATSSPEVQAKSIEMLMLTSKLSDEDMLKGWIAYSKLLSDVKGGLGSNSSLQLRLKVLRQVLKQESFYYLAQEDNDYAVSEQISLKRMNDGEFYTVSTFTIKRKGGYKHRPLNSTQPEVSIEVVQLLDFDQRSVSGGIVALSHDRTCNRFQLRGSISAELPALFTVFATREDLLHLLWDLRETIIECVQGMDIQKHGEEKYLKWLTNRGIVFRRLLENWRALNCRIPKRA